MQAFLLELWESLCSHDLIKQPLPLSCVQSHHLGENSCYRFMCKAYRRGYKAWSEERWKSAEQPALREKGKGEFQTVFHPSFPWGTVRKVTHWDHSPAQINTACCLGVFRGSQRCSSALHADHGLCALGTGWIAWQRGSGSLCLALAKLLYRTRFCTLRHRALASLASLTTCSLQRICWEPWSCRRLCEHRGLHESKVDKHASFRVFSFQWGYRQKNNEIINQMTAHG